MAVNRAILIAGPTASGKSALAVRVAAGLSGAGIIINADSMQVYSDLKILTARPTPEEEAIVPHRLFGVVPAGAQFSVGDWLARTETEIKSAWSAGAVPVVVGGTGLYFEALTKGLAVIPDIPTPIRQKWRDFGAAATNDRLLEELATRDAEMAQRLKEGDRQRLLRALEVVDATGRSLADWQRDPTRQPLLQTGKVGKVVLAPPRQAIYARADARVVAMVEAGALDEVKALLALRLPAHSPVRKAIGVAELGGHLAGDLTLDEAMEKMRTQTRRYAKRQLTWARGRMADWQWVETPAQGQAKLDGPVPIPSQRKTR